MAYFDQTENGVQPVEPRLELFGSAYELDKKFEPTLPHPMRLDSSFQPTILLYRRVGT